MLIPGPLFRPSLPNCPTCVHLRDRVEPFERTVLNYPSCVRGPEFGFPTSFVQSGDFRSAASQVNAVRIVDGKRRSAQERRGVVGLLIGQDGFIPVLPMLDEGQAPWVA